MGPNYPQELCHRKGNYTQNKQTKKNPTDWEKIFVNDVTDKVLVSKIYKQHQSKQPNPKMDRKPK